MEEPEFIKREDIKIDDDHDVALAVMAIEDPREKVKCVKGIFWLIKKIIEICKKKKNIPGHEARTFNVTLD